MTTAPNQVPPVGHEEFRHAECLLLLANWLHLQVNSLSQENSQSALFPSGQETIIDDNFIMQCEELFPKQVRALSIESPPGYAIKARDRVMDAVSNLFGKSFDELLTPIASFEREIIPLLVRLVQRHEIDLVPYNALPIEVIIDDIKKIGGSDVLASQGTFSRINQMLQIAGALPTRCSVRVGAICNDTPVSSEDKLGQCSSDDWQENIPSLSSSTMDWLTPKHAANYEKNSGSSSYLTQARNSKFSKERCANGMCGIDRDGRMWRKENNGRIYYYKPTLKKT